MSRAFGNPSTVTRNDPDFQLCCLKFFLIKRKKKINKNDGPGESRPECVLYLNGVDARRPGDSARASLHILRLDFT